MSVSVANNKRSQMTKLLLKTSLMELMEEKPIRSITIKAIATEQI